MHVVLLSPYTCGTGNRTTCDRISGLLRSAGHATTVLSTDSAPDSAVLPTQAAVVVALHAFHSGPALAALWRMGHTAPLVVIFGGTDVNEMGRAPDRLAAMTDVVGRAAACVCFSAAVHTAAVGLWPEHKQKMAVIAQSVSICANLSRVSSAACACCTIAGGADGQGWVDFLPAAATAFLLPAGVRTVKDPLYLAAAAAQWHLQDERVHLVVVGNALDGPLTQELVRFCQDHAGVHFVPGVRRCELHRFVAGDARCVAVLNTSRSEGQPQAVLEAMALGKPVLVRDIPGNTDVVAHGHTGLVFASPAEWVREAQRLLTEPGLATALVANAREQIARAHSAAQEQAAYAALLEAIVARDGVTAVAAQQ